MKIGILTFHCAHNYGAVLQAYATQEQLKSIGHEVEIIDYRPDYLIRPYDYSLNFKRNNVNIIRRLLSYAKMLLIWLGTLHSKPRRRKGFNRFINERLQLSPKSRKLPFESDTDYDLYIMGSDQIWNSRITKKLDDLFFGNFSTKPNVKKISYAASMPLYAFVGGQKKELEVLLEGFAAISVREKELSDYLFSNFRVSAQVVLDPTLLVKNSVWKKIAIQPQLNQKYVLVYTLSMRKEAMIVAKRIAQQIDAVVVELSDHPKIIDQKYSYSTASPEKFLGWFQEADFVVTSSFHGTAFAISNQKPFYSIARGDERDARQCSLLNNLDLGHRFINKNTIPDYSEIDYSSVLPKWKEWQDKSLEFLTNSF